MSQRLTNTADKYPKKPYLDDNVQHWQEVSHKTFSKEWNLWNYYHQHLGSSRGDRGAVWFGFEHKSHSNRKIKIHAVQFGSVGF
jgi:hypothetical protein